MCSTNTKAANIRPSHPDDLPSHPDDLKDVRNCPTFKYVMRVVKIRRAIRKGLQLEGVLK